MITFNPRGLITRISIEQTMKQLTISDQYHFALQFSNRFGGKESKYRGNSTQTNPSFINLECPCCRRKTAVLYVATNNYTFLLKCPRVSCTLEEAVTLNTAINDYTSDLVHDWNRAIGKYESWGGIQNRRPRGKSLKNKSDGSFKAEMEKNAIRQQVKILMQRQHEEEERFRTFSPPSNLGKDSKHQSLDDNNN